MVKRIFFLVIAAFEGRHIQ